MRRLLLDTAAFLDLDKKGLKALGRSGRVLLKDSGIELLFSAVSITEIAVKTSIGKLTGYTPGLIDRIAQDLQLTVIPYQLRHAQHLFNLPLHHRDPFDRMLIATALEEKCPVMTSDRLFEKYGLQVIW